jgi:hypothetical protein
MDPLGIHVSEERIDPIIKEKRISDLGTTLAVTSKFHPADGGDTFLRDVGS